MSGSDIHIRWSDIRVHKGVAHKRGRPAISLSPQIST